MYHTAVLPHIISRLGGEMLKKIIATAVALGLVLIPTFIFAYDDTLYHFYVVGSDGQPLEDVDMIIYDADGDEYD